jgi:hypothetical protein
MSKIKPAVPQFRLNKIPEIEPPQELPASERLELQPVSSKRLPPPVAPKKLKASAEGSIVRAQQNAQNAAAALQTVQYNVDTAKSKKKIKTAKQFRSSRQDHELRESIRRRLKSTREFLNSSKKRNGNFRFSGDPEEERVRRLFEEVQKSQLPHPTGGSKSQRRKTRKVRKHKVGGTKKMAYK